MIPRKNMDGKYSKNYLKRIKLADFMGQLTPDEVEIAKNEGLLFWDLWVKAGRQVKLTGDHHAQGIQLAPVFDGYGQPDPERYPGQEKTKFLVPDYVSLKGLKH